MEPVPDLAAGGRPRNVPKPDRASPPTWPARSVLDGGCGMGRYLRIAADRPLRRWLVLI